MFYAKRSKAMGISLLVVALLLSIWAMTSVLHAQSGLSALDVSGGATLEGCKDPCNDSGVTSVIECLDIEGTCYDDRCTINWLRHLECTEGTAGCGETDCEYHKDNNDWWRVVITRWMSCEGEPWWAYYGSKDCSIDGAGNPGWTTPCHSQECYGEVWVYYPIAGRQRCD